jgi:hypothetical protein
MQQTIIIRKFTSFKQLADFAREMHAQAVKDEVEKLTDNNKKEF